MKAKGAGIIAPTIVGFGISTGSASASVPENIAADNTANRVMASDDTGW